MSDEIDFKYEMRIVRAKIPGGCCARLTDTALFMVVSKRMAKKVRQLAIREGAVVARSKTIAELFLPRVQDAMRKRYSGSGVGA